MLEIIRQTTRICDASNKIIFRATRKKSFTKGDVMRRVMREQKQSFGELLETKREKIQRLKRSKNFETLEVEKKIDDRKIAGNSEFSWMMRVSEGRLRRISVNYGNEADIAETRGKKIMVGSLETREKRSAELASKARLPRVQTRIFRKSTKRETASEEKICCARENEPLLEISKLPGSEIAPKCSQAVDEAERTARPEKIAFTECQSPPTSRETLGSISSKLSLSVIPRLEDMAERIDGARLFQENEEEEQRYGKDSWRSAKILSVSSMTNKECLNFPSVTKILNVTMSDKAKKMLEAWMAKMIQQLGQEAFDEYKRDLLENGKLFHSSIDRALRKLPVEVPAKLKPCFDSIRSLLDDVKDVRAIESYVVHEELGYKGIFDCVASYRGNLCLIDWKKSDRTKNFLSSTYDAPLQLASYIGALNSDKNYPFQIKSGLLVIAYTTGNKPTVYQLDETKLQYYWKLWLKRLKKYYTVQNT